MFFSQRVKKTGMLVLLIGSLFGFTACTAMNLQEGAKNFVEAIGKIIVPPEKVKYEVIKPADYPDEITIKSIQVTPFNEKGKGSYASHLKKMIESGIANEAFIEVRERSADAVITGNLHVGQIIPHTYQTSYDTDKGKKYTYYYKIKMNISGSYSLTDKNGKVILGDSFQKDYEEKWSSSSSYDEAKANSPTNERISQSVLELAAKDIVAAVSPHRETVELKLERGSDQTIRMGNKYMEKGLVKQAVEIWDQIIEKTENNEDKAACKYNIGVVKEAEGKYAEAFEYFSQANQLYPERELYIDAIARLEKVNKSREKQAEQLRQIRTEQAQETTEQLQEKKVKTKSKKKKKK